MRNGLAAKTSAGGAYYRRDASCRGNRSTLQSRHRRHLLRRADGQKAERSHDGVEIEPDAAEWDYGDCTSFTQDQLAEKYPGWTIWNGPVPNGESIEQISARARRVIERLRAAGGRTAVFAHGHFLRIFTTQYLGLEPQRGRHFALETAAICILGAEQGEPAIVAWNRKGPVA